MGQKGKKGIHWPEIIQEWPDQNSVSREEFVNRLRRGLRIYVTTPIATWRLVGNRKQSIKLFHHSGFGYCRSSHPSEFSTRGGLHKLLEYIVKNDYYFNESDISKPLRIGCSKIGWNRFVKKSSLP